MVVILIRRYARPDREAEFLRVFAAQAPAGNPDFFGETLTRITDGAELPPDVPRLLAPVPSAANYLNVARWRSWNAFARHFAVQLAAPGGFAPAIEVRRAEVAVLDAGDAADMIEVFVAGQDGPDLGALETEHVDIGKHDLRPLLSAGV